MLRVSLCPLVLISFYGMLDLVCASLYTQLMSYPASLPSIKYLWDSQSTHHWFQKIILKRGLSKCGCESEMLGVLKVLAFVFLRCDSWKYVGKKQVDWLVCFTFILLWDCAPGDPLQLVHSLISWAVFLTPPLHWMRVTIRMMSVMLLKHRHSSKDSVSVLRSPHNCHFIFHRVYISALGAGLFIHASVC